MASLIFYIFLLTAGNPNDEAEIISSEQQPSSEIDRNFRDFDGVVDTGSGYPFYAANIPAAASPFGFFDYFQGMYKVPPLKSPLIELRIWILLDLRWPKRVWFIFHEKLILKLPPTPK